MAYPREAEPPVAGTGTCPAPHPVAIPEISHKFAIYVTEETGSPAGWRFSSDLPDVAAPGASRQEDWMNGRDARIMDAIVENCLRPGRDCGVGLLGNGTRLRPVVRNQGKDIRSRGYPGCILRLRCLDERLGAVPRVFRGFAVV